MARKNVLSRIGALAVLAALLLGACAPQAGSPTPAPAITGAPSATQAPALTTATSEPASEPATLTVMAAASLTGAFQELGAQFEAGHPGVTVQFNFAGSQQLAQQLEQGAPADVFASANQKQMDVAVTAGRIKKDAAQTFVKNLLVVVYPKDNPARLEGLDDLAQDNLKLIFAAKEVPVGQYSLDFLDKAVTAGTFGANYKDKVLANVVSYEDNVKSVLTKVALGEADGGIVYSSDVTGDDAQKVGQITIPDALNVVATYPIATVQDAANAELAQEFIALVLSPDGQAILARYGFLSVGP